MALPRLPSLLLALLLPLSSAWAESPAPADSGMNATLLYNSLHAEMLAASGQMQTAAQLMLGVAEMDKDRPELYERATELALQAGHVKLALKAGQAWRKAEPTSADAARYVLQLHLLLGQKRPAVQAFDDFLRNSPSDALGGALQLLPALFAARNPGGNQPAMLDAATAQALDAVLLPYTQKPPHAAVAWAALASLRQESEQYPQALQAAQQALAADVSQSAAAWVLLELLMPQGRTAAQLGLSLNEIEAGRASLEHYAEKGEPDAAFRTRYSAYLLDQQRPQEALAQIQRVKAERPEAARIWLMEGLVLLESKALDAAQTSLEQALSLLQVQVQESDDDGPVKLRDEALLSLALLAQERGDYAQGHAWLNQLAEAESPKALRRRAALFNQEGRWQEALAQLRRLPLGLEVTPRSLLMAEVQVLNQAKQYTQAHARLAAFVKDEPEDADALYMLAMLDERLGQFAAMEQRLRKVMRLQPNDPHAFNALGYTLADRNERLDEAKALIEQALSLSPNDPMMLDSLGWVAYRLGHLPEAHKLLGQAYAVLPDAEVAAHLGEVLWQMGERDTAKEVWRSGLEQEPSNEALQQTLRRFEVKF